MVRALAGQPPASSLATCCRVRWYGHVLRWPLHHPSRAILVFNPGSFGWKWFRKPHAPVGSKLSNAILTSSASIQPQLNPSRRTVINGSLSWIWLTQCTMCRRAPFRRHDDDDEYINQCCCLLLAFFHEIAIVSQMLTLPVSFVVPLCNKIYNLYIRTWVRSGLQIYTYKNKSFHK